MFRRIILISLAAILGPVTGEAAQYYVSPTGSDLAAGTSTAPWKTLQHAADVSAPGDRITARPGSYVGFDLRHSGTAALPIEFDAQPGVQITSPSQVRHNSSGAFLDGINLEGASYITIDGFSVNGMPEAGVRSVGFSDDFASHVTVRNVTATNNGVWGIFTGHVNDLLIESNQTSGSIEQHGIYVSNSGDRPVIRDNVIFNNHGSGIHMNGDLSQGGDGIISGAVISGNLVYNNAIPNSTFPTLGGGSGINMDGVQNSRIENNVLYNNHASGISLYMIDGAAGSSGNVVVNNTVDVATDGRWALNIQDGSTNNTAFNNILLNENTGRGSIDISPDSRSGFLSNYNAVVNRFTTDGGTPQTLTQWRTTTGQDGNSFVTSAASLFVNAGAGNFHLLSTAPAKNTGTSQLAPPGDFDGLPRKAGAGFDIGAFEFGALAGDFNRDGAVNLADYVGWRKTFGTSVTRFTGADGDGSAAIDLNDYPVWRSDFGAVAVGATSVLEGAAVPEPPVLLVVLVAIGLSRAGARTRR
jgi:parallel beta-helix repeat protein